MEESAPIEMKEATAYRVRAANVGPPATLGSFSSTDWKSRMTVINLDQLAPYQGAAWYKQP
jgi:hypothetical protein